MTRAWLVAMVAAAMATAAVAEAAQDGPSVAAPSVPVVQQEAEQPSAEQLRQTIREYVDQIATEEGGFTLEDDATGSIRTLTLERVQDKVTPSGDAYSICADMKDTASGEALDVDFDVEPIEEELEVVDVRIHKVNGRSRDLPSETPQPVTTP